MKDPASARLIILKGFLMLLTGAFASALLLWEHPSFRVALLLGIALWGFMRFYYFAFYVIEKHVDSQFKYSGLGSFAAYLVRSRKTGRPNCPQKD